MVEPGSAGAAEIRGILVAAEKLDTEKLAKVLALVDSSSEGEALAALRRARDMLHAADMGFVDLLRQRHPPRGGEFPERKAAYLEVLVRDLKARLEAAEAEAEAAQRNVQEVTRDFTRRIVDLDQNREAQGECLSARIEELEQALQRAPLENRTATDRREIVIAMLHDPATAKLSNREIARQLGISPQTVSNWRKKLDKQQQGGKAAKGDRGRRTASG